MDPELPDDAWDDEDEDDELPCLIDCDECGKITVVTDPSAVYPQAPERNGKRMVMVCSSACFDAIHERFRPPTPPEEQWAIAIARTVWDHPGEHLTPQRLRELTGLSPEQVSAGAEYLRKRLESESGPGGRTPPK
ncbi:MULTISPECIES: hypothetical protein [Streptomyces]|uniref:Uncharacterized protein n=3 Tax=Streptomyces rimosus TaxID=1927 RepID=L8ELV1_STRR1|nr:MULTISPECIES: hypothetical protein [Streptomyces]KOG82890.1 hypothetical protein ADK78_02910 [Kitasatospora aureofaciens]MYT44634.1 hypothetical protein [Streptomyces sp. SID5471]KEF02108.1 hypothetical protein DF17_35590 [Streptomyces rimosus]KEF15624.1 hypothetical protein DF18_34470 [Streptomyces rimosus]KOT44844.1 hypothetical protein ADK42_04615 [Streptomyces rimosus subsp. rimosus]